MSMTSDFVVTSRKCMPTSSKEVLSRRGKENDRNEKVSEMMSRVKKENKENKQMTKQGN